jgi:hypothetical protein
MLQLFSRYETHATWATVGLLNYANKKDLLAADFKAIPYEDTSYSPFPLTAEQLKEMEDPILFGGSIIDEILNTPNQEWASHTFSHFYCLEKGVSAKDFEADCAKMSAFGKERKYTFKSIVFPRNQVNETCLNICHSFGFSSYRGNQPNRFWKNSVYKKESILKKAGRYIDAYFKCSRTKRFKLNALPRQQGLVNIPASRFLRPYSGRIWLEKRKIRTIKKEMFRAARKKEIYHLWWHPHNFAVAPTIALNQLEELLAYANVLEKKFNFQSMNMGEIAEYVKD